MHLNLRFILRGMLIYHSMFGHFELIVERHRQLKTIHMKLIRKINIPRMEKTAFLNAFL